MTEIKSWGKKIDNWTHKGLRTDDGSCYVLWRAFTKASQRLIVFYWLVGNLIFISSIFILPQKGEQIFGYRQKGVTFEQSLHILLNDSEWMLDAILDSKFWIFILFLSQEYTGPMLLAFYWLFTDYCKDSLNGQGSVVHIIRCCKASQQSISVWRHKIRLYQSLRFQALSTLYVTEGSLELCAFKILLKLGKSEKTQEPSQVKSLSYHQQHIEHRQWACLERPRRRRRQYTRQEWYWSTLDQRRRIFGSIFDSFLIQMKFWRP